MFTGLLFQPVQSVFRFDGFAIVSKLGSEHVAWDALTYTYERPGY
jgi:hypothetical protein